MAQVAMKARMVNGIAAGQNVAVYRIGSGDNARYIAAANVPRGKHSEEILDAYIDDPRNGISWEDVTAIYSERAPCTADPHYCAIGIARYTKAQHDITFSLNPDGVRTGGANAAAIGKAMGDYSSPLHLPDFEWVN